MRLKYYMRGLGIGIILTALMYTLLGTKNSMTEEEIIAQAKKLGMVEVSQVPQDPEGGLLDKIHKDPDSPSLTPDPTPTSIKESEDTKPSISIKPSEITPSPDLEPTEIPNVTEPPQDSTSDNDYIYFTISSGMNSDQVAELVKEKGLISNAQEFDKYLVDNGYANRIRINTYKIPRGSDYKTIAEYIVTEQPWLDTKD